MTDHVIVVDSTIHKDKMWNGLRCGIFPYLLVIWIVVFYSITGYQDARVKQQIEEVLNGMKHVLSMQEDVLKGLETNSMMIRAIVSQQKQMLIHADKPTIYAITPTFARPVQKAELTRLAQTFMHVPNFHWIVVEDSATKTKLVTNFLAESTIDYTHLNAITPPTYKLGKNDPNWKKPRGVEQRNAGLRWLRENFKDNAKGVVYFADDDNTYSIKLFHEMDKIKKVGVWPVGLVGGLMVEKPICDNVTNKVIGFNAEWKPDRTFPLDMAAFAINLGIILEKKNAWFSYETRGGYQETELLEQMVTRDELEPLADFCTKVYVWHTRTEPPQLSAEQRLIRKDRRSNADIEV